MNARKNGPSPRCTPWKPARALDRRDPLAGLRRPVRTQSQSGSIAFRREFHGRHAGGRAGPDQAPADRMLAGQEPAGMDERGMGGEAARTLGADIAHMVGASPGDVDRLRQHHHQSLQDHQLRVEASRQRQRHPDGVAQFLPPTCTSLRASCACWSESRRGGQAFGRRRAGNGTAGHAGPRRRHPVPHPDRLPLERAVGHRDDERARTGCRRVDGLGPLPFGRSAWTSICTALAGGLRESGAATSTCAADRAALPGCT